MTYSVGRCLLRYRLHDAKMTQQELSDKTGINKQQINGYVRNRRVMSLSVAKTIAFTLNCQIEELYEWIEAGHDE